MNLLIRGGRVIDPAQGLDRYLDVWIVEGKIAALGTDMPVPSQPTVPAVRLLDAHGCIVVPGLIDVHTHLREPGFEYKETIATGLAAAAAGGHGCDAAPL